jgi:LmbE family N-acetylglucosaminyl deacetylase
MTPPLAGALRGALRSAYRLTMPSAVREAARLQREIVKREFEPALAEAPAGKRILVLAPHMDDEVFGCGGTLARAVEANSEVRVVFMTDGRLGHAPEKTSRLDAQERAEFETALADTRKAEARRAGALLGYADPVFLDLPDGDAAQAPQDAARRLARAIAAQSPEIVFLPYFADFHADHRATNRLFVDAAISLPRWGASVMCWSYEVWTPLVANTFVDITASMDKKRRAMAVFESQNADMDYGRAIEGLNAHRALAAGVSGGHAEAFFVETLAEYSSLAEMFLSGGRR